MRSRRPWRNTEWRLVVCHKADQVAQTFDITVPVRRSLLGNGQPGYLYSRITSQPQVLLFSRREPWY